MYKQGGCYTGSVWTAKCGRKRHSVDGTGAVWMVQAPWRYLKDEREMLRLTTTAAERMRPRGELAVTTHSVIRTLRTRRLLRSTTSAKGRGG
eukprot:9163808-Pyramimonas_sp.AAC.1